jgi:hypothetical protein
VWRVPVLRRKWSIVSGAGYCVTRSILRRLSDVCVARDEHPTLPDHPLLQFCCSDGTCPEKTTIIATEASRFASKKGREQRLSAAAVPLA